MIITFADRNLRKYADDPGLAKIKLGPRRSRLYQQRLEDLYDSVSFADLEQLPGNYHPLSSNRKEQWACDLDHPYRLIFEPAGDPIPTNAHGNVILLEIISLEIIEIIDYH